jgi:uncharacterized secreted protein with C-terminal beta-propeller domain
MLGQTLVGEKNATFATIKFFDRLAYVATAEENGMFYVLDFADSSDPQVLGMLNISGYADFLHPLNDDNTLLLAVGQSGFLSTGGNFDLQVAIFDVSDPTEPVVLHRLVVDEGVRATVQLESYWEFQSFRYDKQSERLILPVEIFSYDDPSQDFYGFYVLVVNKDGIEQSCRIRQKAPADQLACFSCENLAARSMIFNGSLTTTNYNRVKSTNLNSCKSIWNFTVSISDSGQYCCGQY